MLERRTILLKGVCLLKGVYRLLSRIMIFILVFLLLLLCSCEADLEVVGIQISHFPDKIVYFKGVDDMLDMTGCTIFIQLRSGESIESSAYGEYREFKLLHDIDFEKPGVYEVHIQYRDNESAITKMPIQVIDIN